MAGDWLKIELELPDKPEVHHMANALNLDPDAVVGKLFRVWSWFDKHTENGDAHGVTFALLDRIAGVTGFGEVMSFVGWMTQNGTVLTMPKFDRHTSKSAKTRALTGKRMQRKRDADSVTNASPEKRREDIKEKIKRKKPSSKKTTLPDNFSISENVRAWATEKGFSNLEARLEYFKGVSLAKGYEYADWDAAFRNSIFADWAKLGQATVQTVPSGETDAERKHRVAVDLMRRIGAI